MSTDSVLIDNIVSFCSYLNRTDLKTNNVKFNIDVTYKIINITYKFDKIYFFMHR